MKIDVYCNDGSPIGIIPDDIYGNGVGGAELSLMTWAEHMAARGHRISIYNNPKVAGVYNGVEYMPQKELLNDSNRDVLVVWRSPFQELKSLRGGLKIHWSTDQWTVGNYAVDILPYVDVVVTISPFHTKYYREHYNRPSIIPDANVSHIDLGVRKIDYGDIKKKRYEMIWASVPDRGLDLLLRTWGKIVERVPQAHLSITSDYTLWGGKAIGARTYKPKWARYSSSVDYLSAVTRKKLTQLQLEADIALGSFTYDELFCISSAEAQYAGAVSITSDRGALPTTNMSGVVIPMNQILRVLPDKIEEIYNGGKIGETQMLAHEYAKRRFDWDYICSKWEDVLAMGGFSEE